MFFIHSPWYISTLVLSTDVCNVRSLFLRFDMLVLSTDVRDLFHSVPRHFSTLVLSTDVHDLFHSVHRNFSTLVLSTDVRDLLIFIQSLGTLVR